MGFYMGPLLWEFLSAFVLYQLDHALLDKLYTYILCFRLMFRNDFGHYFPRLQSAAQKYETNSELLPIILRCIQPLQSSRQMHLDRSWIQYVSWFASLTLLPVLDSSQFGMDCHSNYRMCITFCSLNGRAAPLNQLS